MSLYQPELSAPRQLVLHESLSCVAAADQPLFDLLFGNLEAYSTSKGRLVVSRIAKALGTTTDDVKRRRAALQLLLGEPGL